MGLPVHLECIRCGREYDLVANMFDGCAACRQDGTPSNLTVLYDYRSIRNRISRNSFADGPRSIWRYADLLPVEGQTQVTMGEGMTPLVECGSLGRRVGIASLLVKDESRNPTWSFKDRLCSVAVSKGKETGASAMAISSTGNHGAATAAYAARAGLPCVAFTLATVPQTMKVLMQSYGAKLVATRKSEERWILMAEGVRRCGWFPTGSYTNPPIGSNYFGVEGYKTIAFEICESLGWDAPDVVVMPVAYADGLWGTWKGFCELEALGLTRAKPRMVAAECFGSLQKALEKGLDFPDRVETRPTVAFSIGTPLSTYQGLRALRDSGGAAVTVTDEEMVEMQRLLGESEGILAEASSSASLAAARKLRESGWVGRDAVVVCVLTSTGLKDLGPFTGRLPDVPVIEPDFDILLDTLDRVYGFSPGL